ncbi:Uncharacterised protein [Candidatus Bartonella washoeensis]|uniref:Uncharacterized protein n=1 Tax=Candidatus Bartonella washoeensis Sb944nv TaxID=1094563 RepID=J0YU64_9HYPH|nr:hypothetical protein MCQ_01310 [Bartonella washoeensis Sb944nv]SPU27787.1 Uncharacterised protein [Bartonella washoeensis]
MRESYNIRDSYSICKTVNYHFKSISCLFQKIHDKRGARSSGAIACFGSDAFFAGDGGFYQIGSDGQLFPIGFEKVDRTVFSNFDKLALDEMQGVIDLVYNRVYWSLKRSNNQQTTFVYDWGV